MVQNIPAGTECSLVAFSNCKMEIYDLFSTILSFEHLTFGLMLD